MDQAVYPKLESIQMIQGALGKTLGPGELGVLLAWTGVGKTACLTHLALEQMLKGACVLHVCIGETPEKIKLWYHELLKNGVAPRVEEDFAALQYRIEPLRFILAFLHQSFQLSKLEQSLGNLREQAGFSPAMAVVDGLDFDHVERSTIEGLKRFAQESGLSVWLSARRHRHIATQNERGIPYPCHEMDDLFDSILLLEPSPGAISLRVLKLDNLYRPEHPGMVLNSQTYFIEKP
ncbi:MAG: hypothetical protein HGB17_12945 [Syntrophobacteraceae bacterium]|nr:hypothetical protein [Syntrophobacteraceae bacterium]